jgi:two-component system, OmpR family, KDP operon response regulator KdpE
VSTRQRVLVCDDEPQILRALRVILRDAGFEVDPASTATEALDHAAVRPPHAAIIDLVLPDGDGIEVCRQLREWTAMPIIVLSAVGEEEQKVRALEAGADDYVTKPFGARELVARLQAALRRAAPAPDEPVLQFDGLEIDVAAHRVRRDGEEVRLTPIEFELLSTLARNPRAADDAPRAAERGVGAGLCRRHGDAADPHRQPPPEDRALRGRAPVHSHGRRCGLPLRRLSVFTRS